MTGPNLPQSQCRNCDERAAAKAATSIKTCQTGDNLAAGEASKVSEMVSFMTMVAFGASHRPLQSTRRIAWLSRSLTAIIVP